MAPQFTASPPARRGCRAAPSACPQQSAFLGRMLCCGSGTSSSEPRAFTYHPETLLAPKSVQHTPAVCQSGPQAPALEGR